MKVEGYYNRQTGKDENQYSNVYIDPEDLVTVVGNLDRADLTKNFRNNGELKLDLTFMLRNVKNEASFRTYGAWMDNDFTSRYTIEEVTHEQNDAFSYQEARQTAYYNLS